MPRGGAVLPFAGVASVTERKIAPLVPPTLARGSGRRLLAGRNTQLQVGELLARPRAGTLVYGMGRLDSEGRLSNRSTIDALGWTAGDCLSIALVDGSVVAHRDPTGAFVMGAKPYLVLPAALRRRNGLGARDLVLVVADPNHDVLVVHPLAALDTMITAYHAALTTLNSCQSTPTGGAR
ncbi:hypothetical protein GCM10027436_41900 [Actinophytocola sediminis]